MFKKIAVLMMTFASFAAVVPATASAAERGREEGRVVVQKRVVIRHNRHRRQRIVMVKRVEVRNSAPRWR